MNNLVGNWMFVYNGIDNFFKDCKIPLKELLCTTLNGKGGGMIQENALQTYIKYQGVGDNMENIVQLYETIVSMLK